MTPGQVESMIEMGAFTPSQCEWFWKHQSEFLVKAQKDHPRMKAAANVRAKRFFDAW